MYFIVRGFRLVRQPATNERQDLGLVLGAADFALVSEEDASQVEAARERLHNALGGKL